MIEFRPVAIAALAMTSALAAPTPALATTTGGGAHQAVAATAQCIARRLPQGGQVFRASDGTMRVISIGRRGSIARWTVSSTSGGVQIVRSGGPAGLERSITASCS